MNLKNLNEFRILLIKPGNVVSELEYTSNNYDNSGNLIKEELPTITTYFCEIGLFNRNIYFVFIIYSKTFNLDLFNKIKNKSNVKMYGFTDFNKILFPIKEFNFNVFIKNIKKEKYLQIQFDYKSFNISNLFKEYSYLVSVFEKNKIGVVNQLKIDMTKNQ